MVSNTRLTPDGMLAAVESCKALAMSRARSFRAGNPAVPLRDLMETAEYGLRLAALAFDPTRGTAFTTLAYRYVTTELIRFCRLESARGMHVPEGHGRYFAVVRSGFGEPWQHPPAPAAGGPEPDFWEHVARGLDRRDAAALVGYYRDGRSQGQVAAALGVTEQRAGQLIRRAVAKLRGRRELAGYAGPAARRTRAAA